MTEPPSRANRASASAADVLVLGDGIIALSSAIALARAGSSVIVVGRPQRGAASRASAGLLAPSLGDAQADVREIMRIARDRYPAFLAFLATRTGIDVLLNRLGIVELHDGAATAATAATTATGGARAIEPAITSPAPFTLHANDGFVDNVRLLDALHAATHTEWAIDLVPSRATRIERDGIAWRVLDDDGQAHRGARVVVAAGAWTPLIDGLPRALPITPVRGQMLALDATPLARAVAANDVYLVPRGGTTLVGSTAEQAGFDVATTPVALGRLRRAAGEIVSALANREMVDAWSGLRPMTPDALPIVGADPEIPTLIWAVGHGRNGILLAPLTGEIVAAVASGARPPVSLERFAVDRFASVGTGMDRSAG